jgi:hypothetical protein
MIIDLKIFQNNNRMKNSSYQLERPELERYKKMKATIGQGIYKVQVLFYIKFMSCKAPTSCLYRGMQHI